MIVISTAIKSPASNTTACFAIPQASFFSVDPTWIDTSFILPCNAAMTCTKIAKMLSPSYHGSWNISLETNFQKADCKIATHAGFCARLFIYVLVSFISTKNIWIWGSVTYRLWRGIGGLGGLGAPNHLVVFFQKPALWPQTNPNQHYLRECRETTTERWFKHTVVWPSIGAAKPNALHSVTAATRDGAKSFMMNMKRC